MRVDGQIRGEGLIFVDDATICQGSGSVIGLPELTFHDATPTGSHPIFDTMTGTVLNVVRGETPTLPTLAEARLGRIGSDCRTGVACEDTAPAGGIDSGCDEGLPACIGVDDASICVECEVDLDCRGGFVCNVGVRRCQPGPGPSAVDDVLRVAEGGSVSATLVSLAVNDLNVVPATVALGTPSQGSVTVVDGVLTYAPGSDPPAQAVIPYTICGIGPNAEVCVEARVVVMINRAPDLVGAMIIEAVGVPSTSLDLAVRYLDPEGHPLDSASLMVMSVVTTTGELTGTAVVVDGVLVFTPTDPAVPGVVEVRVVGCDRPGLGVPAACGQSVVTFVRNDPPVLGDATVTVNRGGVATVPLSAVLVGTGVVHGDDPGDGDSDGIGAVSVVSGLCEWNGASFVVTATEVIGEVVCVVSVCEEVPLVGVCSESALTVVVVGRVPVVRDDVVTVVEDGSVVVDVLENDEDPDGDSLEIRDITTAPEHGTAVVVDGQVVYTPAEGFVGEDSFVYEACDGDDMCDSAVVTVTVVQGGTGNRQPVAQDDVAEVDEDGEVTIAVLDNDVDPDGDSLEVRDIVNEPGHGTATIVDGAVVYVPNADYNGEDSFTYQVCDGGGLCDTATVTVTVVAVPDEEDAEDGPEVVEPVPDDGPEEVEPVVEVGPEVVEPVTEVGPEAPPEASPETVESNPEDDNTGLEGLTAEGGGGCAGGGAGPWWVGLIGVGWLLRRRERRNERRFTIVEIGVSG
jgi:MYXO-CTERM domain-containing protein